MTHWLSIQNYDMNISVPSGSHKTQHHRESKMWDGVRLRIYPCFDSVVTVIRHGFLWSREIDITDMSQELRSLTVIEFPTVQTKQKHYCLLKLNMICSNYFDTFTGDWFQIAWEILLWIINASLRALSQYCLKTCDLSSLMWSIYVYMY